MATQSHLTSRWRVEVNVSLLISVIIKFEVYDSGSQRIHNYGRKWFFQMR